MKTDLIINPYTQILFKNRYSGHFFEAFPDADYFLVSPVPHEELRFLPISKSRDGELFELFLELSQTQFDLLDVEKDLSDSEREYLRKNGVLVEPTRAPQKPLFYCLLDDVETNEGAIELSNLITNPFFEFQPFSFENLRIWINEKHLSPHQPSTWVKQAATEIKLGYWLDKEQALVASKLKAGEKPAFEIEENLLAKLVAAEILVNPGVWRETEKQGLEAIRAAGEDFRQSKYTVWRGLLPPAQMKALRRFYRQYIEQGFMPFGDPQVKRRFRQVDEPLARFLQENFANLMSRLAGKQIKPSYVYAASYREFAELKPHTDRKQCEFSISFQVDYQPEPEGHLSPWGLYIARPDFPVDFEKPYFDQNFPALSEEQEKNCPVRLASGDAVFYKGCEVVHYRYALPAEHRSTSLFFHYVPHDFQADLLI